MNNEIEKLITSSKDLKLLYVEDNKDARETTGKLLSRFFDDIVIAVDGKDGLEKFKQYAPFDIVITDINMPYTNGIDMAEQIRMLDKEVNILMLSANNEANYFLDAIKIGIDGYLLKPLNMKQLINQLLKTTQKIILIRENEAYKKALEEKVTQKTRELQYRFYHDDLTGLKNRNALLEDLGKKPFAMLSILDIDNFQNYSDIYGVHGSGEILKALAHFLTDTFKDVICDIYHYEADKFVLFFQERIDMDIIRERLKSPFIYLEKFDEYIEIDVTTGISHESEHVIEKVLMALRYAQKHGKSLVVYDETVDSAKDSKNIITWKEKIKQAIKEDRIVPVYQPILDRAQNIVKYEALMRMELQNDGKEELVAPWFFLDIAIKTKQYKMLTGIMAEKSFRFAKERACDFSLNISFEDVSNPQTVAMLKTLTERYGIGERLIFEILESENIEDYKILKKFINQFRELGVRIAIDDFGAGFSNFAHIMEIEPDFLKIDGSMIKNIDTDKKSYEFVKAVVGLTKALGIETVAEFVHSKEVFDICYELGIDQFQGFYFSPPLREEEIETQLMAL